MLDVSQKQLAMNKDQSRLELSKQVGLMKENSIVEDETTNLFLQFNEHNLKRVKDDNKRLHQKTLKLESQIRKLALDLDEAQAKLADAESKSLELRVLNEKLLKQITEKTDKLESNNKNVENIKGLLIESEMKISGLKYIQNTQKDQINKLNIFNSSLLNEIETQKKINEGLTSQMHCFQDKIREIDRGYEKKYLILTNELACLQKQINQMKTYTEDLLVQLRIYESEKDMQKLILVQNKVNQRILRDHHNFLFLEGHSSTKQLNYKRGNMIGKINHAFKKGSTEGTEQNLYFSRNQQELKELIELLKEKNEILQTKLYEKEKRNKTLQNIICNQIKS